MAQAISSVNAIALKKNSIAPTINPSTCVFLIKAAMHSHSPRNHAMPKNVMRPISKQPNLNSLLSVP